MNLLIAEIVILAIGALLIAAVRKQQKNQEEKETSRAIDKMAEQILIEHDPDLQRKAQAIELMRDKAYPSRR